MAQNRIEKQVRNSNRETPALGHHLPSLRGVPGQWQVEESVATLRSFLWVVSLGGPKKIVSTIKMSVRVSEEDFSKQSSECPLALPAVLLSSCGGT